MRSHHQELTLDDLAEIRKQTAFEEAEEPEPRHKERAVRVSKLTEGMRVVDASVKVFENINSKEQQAATRQGTVEMHASYEEIVKENTRYLSRQTSGFDFLNSHSVHGRTYCWTLDDYTDDSSTVDELSVPS
jgi:hypothetical protein